MYSCDGKAEFPAVIIPVFSVTSFRNHSSILIGAQETFIIINVIVLYMYFSMTFCWIECSKEQHSCEIGFSFYNITNVLIKK